MALWKLKPVLRYFDPRWKGKDFRMPLLVDAPTADEARKRAARWEVKKNKGGTVVESAFENQSLYKVVRIDAGDDNPELMDPVIRHLYPVCDNANTGASHRNY